MYLASEKGKRVLNFCYSWGASIVIIGALFKLLHLPYGNQILFVAMTVEALVFFISAFEKPFNEYHWEEVFPVLKSKNPLDRPDFANTPMSNLVNSPENTTDDEVAGGLNINLGGKQTTGLGNLGLDVSEEDTKNLSDSIKKLSAAAEQISKMAELTEATQKYLEQLSGMSENMERFSQVTHSLTDVSDTLLNSYKSITDNSDGINQNSRGYVQQMEMLNRNISGLNTIYEIQLKSISSQIESIEHINSGLSRIREMYDGSVVDSSVFRNATVGRIEPGIQPPVAGYDGQYGVSATGAARTTCLPAATAAGTAAELPAGLSATVRISAAGSVYKQPNEVIGYGRNSK